MTRTSFAFHYCRCATQGDRSVAEVDSAVYPTFECIRVASNLVVRGGILRNLVGECHGTQLELTDLHEWLRRE